MMRKRTTSRVMMRAKKRAQTYQRKPKRNIRILRIAQRTRKKNLAAAAAVEGADAVEGVGETVILKIPRMQKMSMLIEDQYF